MRALINLAGDIYPPLAPFLIWGLGLTLIYLIFSMGIPQVLLGILINFCKTHGGRFAFSVGSGVCTWFLTHGLFGHGVENASLTAIATAAVIGGITKFIGDA